MSSDRLATPDGGVFFFCEEEVDLVARDFFTGVSAVGALLVLDAGESADLAADLRGRGVSSFSFMMATVAIFH